jgi:ribosomal protein S18 acetylase RimI-like enzyme
VIKEIRFFQKIGFLVTKEIRFFQKIGFLVTKEIRFFQKIGFLVTKEIRFFQKIGFLVTKEIRFFQKACRPDAGGNSLRDRISSDPYLFVVGDLSPISVEYVLPFALNRYVEYLCLSPDK